MAMVDCCCYIISLFHHFAFRLLAHLTTTSGLFIFILLSALGQRDGVRLEPRPRGRVVFDK